MKTALIIDDDADAISIAEQTTRRAGFEPQTISSAETALRAAPSLRPQLFIVEIKLEDALGFEVTRAIRKHPMLYQAEVLLTSNGCEQRDVEYGLQEGADSFLRKRFTADECSERVAALQRLHTQVQENCPVTGFGSVYGLRRKLDHHIFREEDFALCYIIPKGMSKLHREREEVRITQVAQTTAAIIKSAVHNDGFYETYCGHLGSGHFMVKVSTDDHQRFYQCMIQRFAEAHAQRKNGACLPSSMLRFGLVLNRAGQRYRTSAEMFSDVRRSHPTQGAEAVGEKSSLPRASKRTGHEHWSG